ncbi:MAG: DNA-binding protein [Planctomycetes bacterium RBG_16_59_8]|nr:MAG: DNA-binding protein [Planctomycetes bacterium RBG_16_59_8]
MVRQPSIVIDTNVVVSALRSRLGAAHKLLLLVGTGRFQTNISVPLALEYESALKRIEDDILLTGREIDDVLDYICKAANHRRIFFLWRPFLRDPKDDLVLELAVSAGCGYIVTFNEKDFHGAEEQFGVNIVAPGKFLRIVGVVS